MAAGLGFKDFVTGEVLTAADVDGYLMQGVWVFASAAARDAAVTSPQEGNFAYLKDTNVTTYYTGSAWANLDTTGMTNPMTTTGDTIYSSSGSTPARLGIGSTGQVLTVAGGIPSWATPAGGGSGFTLINSTTFSSSAAVNLNDVFSSTYQNYRIIVNWDSHASSAAAVSLRLRVSGSDNTSANYRWSYLYFQSSGSGVTTDQNNSDTKIDIGNVSTGAAGDSATIIDIFNPQTTAYTTAQWNFVRQHPDPFVQTRFGNGAFGATTSFTGCTLLTNDSTNMTGKVRVYGYSNS